MIKDPVCGMRVNEETAGAKAIYREHIYYFCSALCKHLFEREPEKYIATGQEQQKP